MPPTAPPVQIEFVERAADVDEALWRACFRDPQEGFFWYRTLDASGLGDQFEFAYALIRRADAPVGIAPCFVFDVPIGLVAPAPVAFCLRRLSLLWPRVGHQRTLFIGSPCADEGMIGLIPGVALDEVLGALSEAVLQRARQLKAPMVVFKDFPGATLPALAALPGYCPTVSYPGTLLELPGAGKGSYLKSLSHNQRHNLRKKLRRSGALLPLETKVVKRPSDAELAEIFGLFQQTYARGKTKFERLDRRFFEQIREEPPAWFILQRDPAGGALVAFMLVFRLGDRLINKFIGLDYGRGDSAFLYFRLFDAALDLAYATGARELQSGQTGYRAKLDLGHGLVPLFNVFRHQHRLVHAVFGAIGRRVTWSSLDPELAAWLRAHPDRDAAADAGQ